jgi:glycosyltransferase involved in cell wall biosynthesis
MGAGSPRVGVFHSGTQHSAQTALAFQESGQLAWFATSIFYDPNRWPYRVESLLPKGLSGKVHRSFLRRYSPELDTRLIRRLGVWPWVDTAANWLGNGALGAYAFAQSHHEFPRRIIELIERSPVDVLWGYDTGSTEVFRWAKRRGIYCVLDRTIGHSAVSNRILECEYERHPEFFARPIRLKPQDVIDYENEEIVLADVVVVGSRFCAATLVDHGCPPEKVRLLPYGYDERIFPGERPRRATRGDAPLKFLFAGDISPRKGAAYLLKAFSAISTRRASLTMLGKLSVPERAFAPFRRRVDQIQNVPRTEVVQHYLDADCFLFPSLFEGSALVLREIYGGGVGAVHTEASGEGVVPGHNGEIIAAGSTDAIVDVVERLADDRGRLQAWQEQSWRRRGECTWSVYRRSARQLLEKSVGTSGPRAAAPSWTDGRAGVEPA